MKRVDKGGGQPVGAVRSPARLGARLGAGLLGLTMLAAGCATTREASTRQGLEERAFAARQPETAGEEIRFDDGALESYVAYAMQHNPALEALFEQWRAGVHHVAGARRLPDPVISYAYFIRNVETRVGPQRHRVSLKQTFPWPTLLSAGADAVSAKAQALERQFDARAIAIAATVAERYWTIWGLRAERRIHEAHVAILQGLSESAGARLMTGRIDLADRQQIDLKAARAADLVRAVDEQILQAEAALKEAMSAPQSAPVPIESSPPSGGPPEDAAALLSAVRSHPRLQAFGFLAASHAEAARREQASRYPSFTVGLDWIETGEAAMPDVAESGKDAVLIGVGVSVPIWQPSYEESVSAYRAEARAVRAEQAAAEDAAEARFYTVLSALRDAHRRVALYRHTLIPQAEGAYESVLGAYVSGAGGIAALLLAEADLLDVQVGLVRVETELAKAWASLSDVVGRPMTPGGVAGSAETRGME